MDILQIQHCHFFAVLLKKIPVGFKDAVLSTTRVKNKENTVNCFTHEENIKNHTITIYIFRELSISIYMKRGTWRRYYQKVHTLPGGNWKNYSGKFSMCLEEWYSNCGRLGSSEHLPVQDRLCEWGKSWITCQEKCWQTFRNCSTIMLQQSHLLCLCYQCTLQSSSLPIVWYLLQQGINFGASSNHLLWKS